MSLFLVDTSAWARTREPGVGKAIARAIEGNSAVITVPILLELLCSARSEAELKELADDYAALHLIPLTPEIERRSLEVQHLLSKRGFHRGPSPVDLLSAAAAESVGAEIWHRDRDFELIAAATGQRHRRL